MNEGVKAAVYSLTFFDLNSVFLPARHKNGIADSLLLPSQTSFILRILPRLVHSRKTVHHMATSFATAGSPEVFISSGRVIAPGPNAKTKQGWKTLCVCVCVCESVCLCLCLCVSI